MKESARRLQDATAAQTGPSTEDCVMRIVWILAYIGLFLVFCYQTSELGRKYLHYPTKVEIEIVSRSNLDFPAVTVCNNNPIRKSLIGRIRDHEDLILLDDYAMKSVHMYAESYFGASDSGDEVCGGSHFRCANGEYCIPEQWVCDDVNNCKDNSDEELDNCTAIKLDRKMAESIADHPLQGICHKGFIQCPDKVFCAVPCDNNHECSSKEAFDESLEAGCTLTVCGENLTASSTPETLTSPDFDSNYPDDLNCTWTIKAPEGHSVHVTFKEVSIEGEMGNCKYDFVQFKDGATSESGVIKVDKKTRVCGKQVPKQTVISSTNETLTILFRSDENVALKGFQIEYKAVVKNDRSRRHADISFNDVVSFESLSILSKKATVSRERKRRDVNDFTESTSENGTDYTNDENDYATSITEDYGKNMQKIG